MKVKFLLSFFMAVSLVVHSAIPNDDQIRRVRWAGIKDYKDSDGSSRRFLYFDHAVYQPNTGNLPLYSEQVPVSSPNIIPLVKLASPVYIALTPEEAAIASNSEIITAEARIFCKVATQKKVPNIFITVLPFRKNPSTGALERLVSFGLDITAQEADKPITRSPSRSYAANSVLATGNWYKVAVTTTGVYKLSYNDLQAMGINVSAIDPRNIRIYGNGGGMLPESNALPRFDDLVENAILVPGETDGHFDQGDYILFYGQSPHTWTYKAATGRFSHQVNYYSNYTYYFITTDLGPGKRLQPEASSSLPANQSVTNFQDYGFHETDSLNLISSGKIWYGETFDLKNTWSLPPFNFPDIDGNSQVYLEGDFAARSTSNSVFNVYVEGGLALTTTIQPVSSAFTTDYAMTATDSRLFYLNTPVVHVSITYVPQVANSIGWLHYLEINVVRNLNFSGNQVAFRNTACAGAGNITDFTITNASTALSVWDVSDPRNIKLVEHSLQGSSAKFRLPTDTLKEFIAFDGSGFNSISSFEKISNQNLHAAGQQDMIIFIHPDFVVDANRLANIHRNEGLKVLVVEVSKVYNEFSSGAQDVSGIRDFIKMVYDESPAGKELKYVLMFGDGSCDYKNRVANNNNFVPTFESLSSLRPTESYVTDDFFGLMDTNEGLDADGVLDVGIGRFPIRTVDQGATLVDKIERYMGLTQDDNSGHGFANTVPRFGDWRNILCFVGDDKDNNMHIDQADAMASMLDTTNKEYNIDKIYFDSYVEVSTPGGQRYPDVNDAINKRVGKGALIINYTGHGGETGWAHERVLEISDISNWSNEWDMPVFVTATCEFSRFDDPALISAGEQVLLNPKGGGIALFTTTRLSFSSTNFALNMNFYNSVFKKVNGNYPKMGDVMVYAKTPSNPNIRNFVLLGDPALGIVYPRYKVATSTINGKVVGSSPDTLKAYSKATVTGYIIDDNGNKITDFNGIIYPTVFDKPSEITTLANDPESYPKNFSLQKNVLYKGKVSVVNGDFTFTFIVPRDIAYHYGKGKISYYAQNNLTDANGYYDNFIIGGTETNFDTDYDGPMVKLFMNDTNFVFGGITDENPMLLAIVSDPHGINTVGNGIGHDVVAILDDNTDKSIVLNDYYESDLDSYQHGVVKFPFSGLSEGLHNLSIKVWDSYNNSSEAYTEFTVVSASTPLIQNLRNYPNPFRDYTSFTFQHNQQGVNLDVEFRIFDISGRLVKTIRQNVLTDGYQAGPIVWNGSGDNGAKLSCGMYLYNLKIITETGQTSQKTSKLVLLREQFK